MCERQNYKNKKQKRRQFYIKTGTDKKSAQNVSEAERKLSNAIHATFTSPFTQNCISTLTLNT